MTDGEDFLRQQAWDYFALHAQQRLTTLNFYLILATTLTAAAVASFDDGFRFPGLRLPTGLILSLFSFAFWRLDVRNRELIKASEAALREFEREAIGGSTAEPPARCLFWREHAESERRKGEKGLRAKLTPRSYSHVFNVLFGAFFVAGLMIALLAIS